MPSVQLQRIQSAAGMLRHATRVAVMTGAGISAESGIATFRDALTGVWQRFRAEDLATLQAFRRDPPLVWGWYEARRKQVLASSPNRGHYALAKLAPQVHQLTLITQNVDDLHERAGSTGVLHLHGSLFEPRCVKCEMRFEAALPAADEHQRGVTTDERETPPLCPDCGGMIRPGVVWFGESLPQDVWQAAKKAVQECNVLLIVGTSGVVQPAAGLAELAFRKRKGIIQINPSTTGQDRFATHVLTGAAGTVLPQLLQAAWPEQE